MAGSYFISRLRERASSSGGMSTSSVSDGTSNGYAAFDIEYYVALDAPPPALPLPPAPPPSPPMAPMVSLVRSAVTMSTNDPSSYSSTPGKCIDNTFDKWWNLCMWQASDLAPWVSVELGMTSSVATVEIYTSGGGANKLTHYQV